jgi:hypothetical protein
VFGNVFLKTLRDQRRGLTGWGIGVVLLVPVEAAFWPSIRDMPDLKEFLGNYPEAMQELFNLMAMTTPSGFMNAELFTLLLPLLFIVFGVGRGARMIAGEEEAGTLDVVLVTPVSTAQLVLHKAAALAVSLVVLGVLLFGATLASSVAFGLGAAAGDVASGSLAMMLLRRGVRLAGPGRGRDDRAAFGGHRCRGGPGRGRVHARRRGRAVAADLAVPPGADRRAPRCWYPRGLRVDGRRGGQLRRRGPAGLRPARHRGDQLRAAAKRRGAADERDR